VNWLVSVEVNLIARPVSLILYSAYSLYSFVGHSSALNQKDNPVPMGQGKNFKRWYFAFSTILLVLGTNYLLAGIQFMAADDDSASFYKLTFASINTFLISFLPVLLLVFPDVIYGLPRRKTSEPTAATGSKAEVPKKESDLSELLSKPEINPYFEELANRVMKCFEQDKMFLDPDFSVDRLALKIEVPRHHVYYLFNSIIGQKFTVLKNNYRVRHAQELLRKTDLTRFTIDSVGEQSGFSSRSNFYSCFREVTGQSPTDFLQAEGKSH
jgi:AraC-like DNA-binding protein